MWTNSGENCRSECKIVYPCKHTLIIQTRNSKSKYLPKEMKTQPHEDLYTNIYTVDIPYPWGITSQWMPEPLHAMFLSIPLYPWQSLLGTVRDQTTITKDYSTIHCSKSYVNVVSVSKHLIVLFSTFLWWFKMMWCLCNERK